MRDKDGKDEKEEEDGRVKKGKKEGAGKEKERQTEDSDALCILGGAVYIPNLGHTGTDAISAPLSLVRSQGCGGENESWNSKQGGPLEESSALDDKFRR